MREAKRWPHLFLSFVCKDVVQNPKGFMRPGSQTNLCYWPRDTQLSIKGDLDSSPDPLLILLKKPKCDHIISG